MTSNLFLEAKAPLQASRVSMYDVSQKFATTIYKVFKEFLKMIVDSTKVIGSSLQSTIRPPPIIIWSYGTVPPLSIFPVMTGQKPSNIIIDSQGQGFVDLMLILFS